MSGRGTSAARFSFERSPFARGTDPCRRPTNKSLLVELMIVLAPVGFDPLMETEAFSDGEPEFTDNIVALRPRPH